ncbi:MAG: hypothetical protein KF688_10595 [Pirellulales bacterium]|nr:hypothetical protein [Pirellulales bacterium]
MTTSQPVPGAATSSTQFVLGVDGGGTKTAALLARVASDGTHEILGSGVAGPSNPLAAGVATARGNLAEAAAEAWRTAGLDPRPADAAVFAVAGTGRPEMAAQMQTAVEEDAIARRAQFIHDADAVLAAGTPAGWGVALIAGTGSSAVGVSPQGERFVCGGWGYRYGDEGSGYWLGREALAAVAQADDGRAAPTLLAELILAKFACTEPRAILAALVATGDERAAIASVSPLVAEAAFRGDAAATRLLGRASDHLAQLVVAAATRLELPQGYPLALAGGVLCRCDAVRQGTVDRLAEASPAPGIVRTAPDPAAGCILLAAKQLAL